MKYSYGNDMSRIRMCNQSRQHPQPPQSQAAQPLLKDSGPESPEQSAGTCLTMWYVERKCNECNVTNGEMSLKAEPTATVQLSRQQTSCVLEQTQAS